MSNIITSDEIFRIIQAKFSGAIPRIGDTEYLRIDDPQWVIDNILRKTTMEGWIYEPERWDCDNYSGVLWGWAVQGVKKFGWARQLPFGMADGKFHHVKEAHSLNFVIVTGKVMLVEPQTDGLRHPLPGDTIWRYWM